MTEGRLPAQTHESLEAEGLGHGFFGRRGGVSRGLFEGLNCGYGSSDDRADVRENRNRIAGHLRVPLSGLLTLYQIHSPDVVTVEEPWEAEASTAGRCHGDQGPRACAFHSDGRLRAGAVRRPSKRAWSGAAHAGWKGALGGVLEATVDAMEALGASRTRIKAVIGPCISQESYEVGPEFFERFVLADETYGQFFAPSARAGHHRFDLPAFAASQLTRAGIGAVAALGACTYAQPADYFSFRRTTHAKEPDYGRNLSAILLKA